MPTQRELQRDLQVVAALNQIVEQLKRANDRLDTLIDIGNTAGRGQADIATLFAEYAKGD